jgi:hypothetical protein
MNKQRNLPVEGKAIRFAPSRNQEPAASLWKVWAEGSEVYASSRNPGGSPKISVHASGQIHYRLGAKLKQDLAPLMRLGTGAWFHAFELRFLLSEGALSPLRQRESLKNKSGYLIQAPEGFVLHANLIIGSPGTPLDCPLPVEFTPAGQTIWRKRLRDGRPAVLVARLLKLDDQNRQHIKYMREELKPTATFPTMPTPKYLEIYHLHWSPQGGNVILVAPMGEEAFRSEQDLLPPGVEPTAPRHFRYRCSRSTVDLIAPNGRRVAVIEAAEVDKQIELVKGLPTTVELGLLTMRIEPSNLIVGSKFIAAPRRLVCNPTVGGASPRDWGYMIHARFDGSCFSAELDRQSTSLRNRNLATPVSQLDSGEELVMTIPAGVLKLTSTLDLPSTSTALLGRFSLQDWR